MTYLAFERASEVIRTLENISPSQTCLRSFRRIKTVEKGAVEATRAQSLVDDRNPRANGAFGTPVKRGTLRRGMLDESLVERDTEIVPHDPVDRAGPKA